MAAIDFAALPPIESGSTLAAEWMLAWRHLRSKKSDAFLSFATVLSIIGVVASVATLNWVISVMTGFEVDLRDKILGANAHIVVFRHTGAMTDYHNASDQVQAIDGIEAASPFVYTEMMIRSAWSHTGIVMKGIDPERTGPVTHLYDDLCQGYDGEITTEPQRDAVFSAMATDSFVARDAVGADPSIAEAETPLSGIIIGEELQDVLQVRPGDKVQIINPVGGGIGPMGMPTPSVKAMRIAGVFCSGMYEYDNKWTYVVNETAQEFLKIGPTVNGIEVRVTDIDDVEEIGMEIEEKLGSYFYIRHWKNLNAKLFDALELEKWVMGLVLNQMVMIAGLLIVSTLFMLVYTKGREIAILKAMGAGSVSIMRIFVMEGFVIGVVGTILGTALGLVGCEFLRRYEYPLETDVYYLSTLPVVVDPAAVVTIALSAFTVSFVCTLYPAWRAAQVDPVEALRYQ